MLAIAASSFGQPSETFIRDHARLLPAANTVLICHDGGRAEGLAGAVLTQRMLPSSETRRERAYAKLRAAVGLIGTPGLYGADRRRVADYLRRHSVRVLLAEYGTTGVALIGPCRDARVPLYVHFHGADASIIARMWHWRRRYRQLFAAAAGVIAPSRFLADRLGALGCPETKLHVSPNGVDTDRFTPGQSEPGRLIAVGRLVEKKAPHLTIQAFARVVDACPGSHLDLIGDGELRARCEALIASLGLEQAITMHGFQPPEVVSSLMSRAALFVQHSVTAPNGDVESFGVSLAEAQACGLPVVATRHNGFPETISDGHTGFLVDEHDIGGMADIIIALLRDPDRAAAMGRAGRERVLSTLTRDHTARRLRAIMGLDDPLHDTTPLEASVT